MVLFLKHPEARAPLSSVMANRGHYSNDMMRDNGVNVVSLFYLVCDLMRDWRHPPGYQKASAPHVRCALMLKDWRALTVV